MADKFEQWGIVELMGHQQTAGRLTEENIAGANMLRVDFPDGDGFRTAYYGPSAIYALHVTEEKVARAAASTMGRRPPYAYVVDSGLRKLAAPPIEEEPEEFEHEDHDDEPETDDVEF